MAFYDVLSQILHFILSIITPPDGTKYCPKDFNGTDTPSAAVFFANLRPMQIAFLAIGVPMTIIIVAIGAFQFYHVFTLVSSKNRRKILYFLISLLPVSSMCCLLGMILPRTAILLTSIGLLYFLTCLFVLVSLIRHLTNGREQLALSLTRHRRMINFQSPPCCCLLSCLPKAQPTEKNLQRLEFIVLQAPIVRLIILFGQVIAVAELRERSLGVLHVFEILSVVSLLLAIFGTHTLARVVSGQLSRYGFIGIFRLVDFALLFFSAQQPILFQNILIRLGLIGCGPVLSTEDNARFICNFVIIAEMFLLSVGSLFIIHPKSSSLFDKYPSAFNTLVSCERELAEIGADGGDVVLAPTQSSGSPAFDNDNVRVSSTGYRAASGAGDSTTADSSSVNTQITLLESDR